MVRNSSSSKKNRSISVEEDGFIQREFIILDKIGEGAYGTVYSAQERKTGKLVAIKKIEQALNRLSSCKRTFRELKLLSVLKHENVIPIRHIVAERSKEDKESKSNQESGIDLFLILDLMETDLTSIIKSPQHLSNEHVQFFIYQVLRSLKYIHSANVIHRDLKPRNLLVNSTCDLRICDFGLARLDIPELIADGECMTDYVATRWYRPAEVVCNAGTYTKAIDMWSVGCILAELLLRKPIFPASDQHDLLKRICEILGPIPDYMIEGARNEKLQAYLRTLSFHFKTPIYPLRSLLKGCCPKALDLLERLLVIDPKKRLTVDEALRHPFMASLYCPEDEPTREAIDDPDFDFEFSKDVTVDDIRVLIQRQLDHYARVNGCGSRTAVAKSAIRYESTLVEEEKDNGDDEDEEKKVDDIQGKMEHVKLTPNNQKASPSSSKLTPKLGGIQGVVKKSPVLGSHATAHREIPCDRIERED